MPLSRKDTKIVLQTSIPPGTEVYHFVGGLGRGVMANQREEINS
jgi:hypothetical protein